MSMRFGYVEMVMTIEADRAQRVLDGVVIQGCQTKVAVAKKVSTTVADKQEVGQFIGAASALLRILHDDFDLSPSDEVLIEGMLHYLMKEWLDWQQRRASLP